MKLDVIDIQDEQYRDAQFIENEMPYTDRNKIRRMKRKRRNRIYTMLGLTGCLILLASVIYLGTVILDKAENSEAEDVMAEIEAIQPETIEQSPEEIQSRVQLAVDTKEAEILGGIKQSLQNGESVVETLRMFYPDDLVLVSGGKYHFVPVNPALKKNNYDEACLNRLESGEMQYVEDGVVTSHKGIDVSSHQGDIDWQKVAEDGVEFAFLRAVYRGYGTGKLVEDAKFEENIEGALNAGIKVGVYVYSQAITEEELLEEANLVLNKIAPYKIECPVVFDVEMVSGADGRMNGLSAEERTNLVTLFCETVKNAGYRPMIYHNMEMGALKVNLQALEDYDKWFAYYNPNFYYPYEYDVWQYSEKGRVNGIEGNVDLNISFVPLWE